MGSQTNSCYHHHHHHSEISKMSNAKDVKFSLKLMMNKQKNKVLFAEADSDFADVLLSFVTLPLGTIVRVLNERYQDKAPVFGSLTTLYNGLSNLGSDNFWTEGGKQMLLNPRSSFQDECRKRKFTIDDHTHDPMKYFRCGNRDCSSKRSSPLVSMYYDSVRCDCGSFLSKAMMSMIESKSTEAGIDDGDGGVFTKERVSFLITDDLKMAPVVPGSMLQNLINLGVSITDGAELMTMSIGFDEIIDLLRGSLLSDTPLTDLILHESRNKNNINGNFQLHMVEEPSSKLKKISVKAWVRESTRTIMFLKAGEDFVDFLFSLLVIPLGGVESLLGSNTLLRSIDNLYRSMNDFIDDKYLKMPDIKNRLTKPEIPPYYLSKNHVFPMSEQMNHKIYFLESVRFDPDYTVEKGCWMRFKDPKGDEGTYVKGSGTFIVTDDLTVMRIKHISSFMAGETCSSDAKTMEMHIGLEEALNILKASLTSTSALSDGLRNLILEKLPEQEH